MGEREGETVRRNVTYLFNSRLTTENLIYNIKGPIIHSYSSDSEHL